MSGDDAQRDLKAKIEALAPKDAVFILSVINERLQHALDEAPEADRAAATDDLRAFDATVVKPDWPGGELADDEEGGKVARGVLIALAAHPRTSALITQSIELRDPTLGLGRALTVPLIVALAWFLITSGVELEYSQAAGLTVHVAREGLDAAQQAAALPDLLKELFGKAP